jgi:osmotically-inducible protein OsmY
MKVSSWCVIMVAVGVLVGCSQKEIDHETKADIATKAKSDPDFAGVYYSVSGGTVTLSGNCPSQLALQNVSEAVSKIAGVKKVINQLRLAPVVLGTDHQLKVAVDSTLKNYPEAIAYVQDSVVTLTGKVQPDEVQKLMDDLAKLHPKELVKQVNAPGL